MKSHLKGMYIIHFIAETVLGAIIQ